MNSATITSLAYLTLGVVLFLLGIIILKEDVRQRINRITAMMMFFAGTGPLFGAFGLLLQNAPEAVDLDFFRRLFLIWEFFFPQMLLFACYFPSEFKWIKRRAYLQFLIFIPHLVHFLLILVFSSPEQIRNLIDLQTLSDRFGLIIEPVAILLGLLLSALSLIYKFHVNFFALINLIYIIAAISLMMWGYRQLKTPRLKKQVRLVLWGIRASVGLYTVAFIFPRLALFHTSPGLQYLLTTVALMIGAGSIAWAIIRYQFLDIRFIIRRGLIITLASSVLIGIYLLIYSQGKKLISDRLDLGIPILEIVYIIFALFSFQPILEAMEHLIERIFMRDRRDYRNVLHDLSHDIMTTLDTVALQKKITDTLRDTMSLKDASLLVADSGLFRVQKEDKTLTFRSNESWIHLLREAAGPIGFDELSVRTGHSPSMDLLRELNAFLFIPFIHRNSLSGILILGEKASGTRFTAEDMTMLSVLSNQAAIAMENSKLYEESLEKHRIEEELALARDIQKNLLPANIPSGSRFELAGYNLPSKEIGGDYYDFIELGGDKIGIAIGDIAGKGIPAAILMSNLQAALRISALRTANTRDVLQQVNVHITKTTSPERFATFFYSVFDPVSRTLEYTNAGHNFPILFRKNGSHDFLREGGIIVGVLEDAQYSSRTVTMEPGDCVVLYTDGVTEALNQKEEEFGEEKLLEVSKASAGHSAQEILNHILESVADFTHGDLQSDDVTLVVLKVKGDA